jgi:hypothetical protein
MMWAVSSTSSRPLTAREAEVLRAMLAVDLPDAEVLREQVSRVRATDFPDGRPSIYLSDQRGGGMRHYSNGAVVGGGTDGIVSWTADARLYALEWFGSEDAGPEEFPPASRIRVTPAGSDRPLSGHRQMRTRRAMTGRLIHAPILGP